MSDAEKIRQALIDALQRAEALAEALGNGALAEATLTAEADLTHLCNVLAEIDQ